MTETRSTESVFEHLEHGLGLIHEVYTVGHNLPLYGRIIAVSEDYITVEKRSGRKVTVRKTEIRSIGETYNQPEA